PDPQKSQTIKIDSMLAKIDAMLAEIWNKCQHTCGTSILWRHIKLKGNEVEDKSRLEKVRYKPLISFLASASNDKSAKDIKEKFVRKLLAFDIEEAFLDANKLLA
ncbi:12245_t:CDS:2, partial [Racocetra persica]